MGERHTYGPWEAVLPEDARGQPVPFYRGLVALVSMDPPVSVVACSGEVSSKDWRANARLIAAAPELCAAAMAALNAFAGDDRIIAMHARDLLESALEKAGFRS